MNRIPRPVALACAMSAATALTVIGPAASAYEASTTHPGLTGRAALDSTLHRFLIRSGFKLGVFTPLKLKPTLSSVAPSSTSQVLLPKASDPQTGLSRALRNLPTAGGYAPDRNLQQWALGWISAGSVLAGYRPRAEAHHALCISPANPAFPPNSRSDIAWFIGLLAPILGDTKTDHPEQAALRWIHATKNPASLTAFAASLKHALTDRTPELRGHSLALSLMHLGDLLHVLEDMGSPTHVRRDQRFGHFERLGGSLFDRASVYERFVANRYGRLALPRCQGKPVRRKSVAHFFSASDRLGLADRTHDQFFSPGTLPRPLNLRDSAAPGTVLARAKATMPFVHPPLEPLRLEAAQLQTQYMGATGKRRLAYDVDAHGTLRFHIDQQVLADTAETLLPLTACYAAGLINHLLRARIALEVDQKTTDQVRIILRDGATTFRQGEARLLLQRPDGSRRLLASVPVSNAAKGDALASLPVKLPQDGKLMAVVSGLDASGDPVIAVAQLEEETHGKARSGQRNHTRAPATSRPVQKP